MLSEKTLDKNELSFHTQHKQHINNNNIIMI